MTSKDEAKSTSNSVHERGNMKAESNHFLSVVNENDLLAKEGNKKLLLACHKKTMVLYVVD